MTHIERHEERQTLYRELINRATEEAQRARDYKATLAKRMRFASLDQMSDIAERIKEAGTEAKALDDFRLTLESLRNDEEEAFNTND